jgi:hypothetical protein
MNAFKFKKVNSAILRKSYSAKPHKPKLVRAFNKLSVSCDSKPLKSTQMA